MEKILKILAEEFSLEAWQVENTVALIDEGCTIPFIARYRKEKTGSLSDDVLRDLYARLNVLRALDEKRADIMRLIDEQGKLDDKLKEQIENAKTQTELDDIYRPYRPKRRTRATIAKEKGLEPLAMTLIAQNPDDDIIAIAEEYINDELDVKSGEEALAGACDIIAEMISDNADA
ncbi:MAG: RNA-binding transcriptional accessory protein, partial [Clostridia bacterium]|nr:RNA-binding transcriptional accessory protein [Clostridia bacterium]